MKLQELKEDRERDEEILDQAKTDFINSLVTDLGGVLASSFAVSQSSPIQQFVRKSAPETPEQIRKRKQAAAAQTAQAGMTSKSTQSASVPSPEDVINPKYTPGPMPDGFTQINLTRPNRDPQVRYIHKSHLQSWLDNGWKQGAGDGSVTWADKAALTRQQKQAQAAQTAQAGMTDKPVTNPAVWRSGRNPDAPATPKESTQFDRLNALFESIINVDEAATEQAAISTSDLIISNFIKHMNAPYIFNINNPAMLSKLKQFADEIERTYPQDKGRTAIAKMGEWAWDTMSEFKQRRNSTKWGSDTSNQPAQASVTSGPTINADGSITIAGAKGEAPGKVLPGDPMYRQLAAAINSQIVKNK